MSVIMDLIAGDAREILLAISTEDWQGLRDPGRFAGYLPLGGRMDPSWLDLLACAAREITADDSPGDFTDACCPLHNPSLARLKGAVDRTIERVEPRWVHDVATLPDRARDAIAGRWIELIDLEECEVEPDDKPMIRALVGELIDFCRRADDAEDVLLAWTM